MKKHYHLLNQINVHIYQIFMQKKIYTFSLTLFVALILLYVVWAFAANIQKEALKRHLSKDWSLTLSDTNITTYGFPFKFGLKASNFQSPIKNTTLTLEFLQLEVIRLIYNFSDIILFVNKPMINKMGYPKFNSSSKNLKVSISDKPFSGRFRLITEQEDWQLSDDKNFNKFEAKKVIFALKDADEMTLDFYFQADNLDLSILDKIQEKNPEKPNKLILKGGIFNSAISIQEKPYQLIRLKSIMLNQIDIDIGFFKLSCNKMVTVNLLNLTTEDDVDCLLKPNQKAISKIKTDNQSIQSIIDFVNLLLIINNPTGPVEPQAIPVKLSLNKGLFYINAIPIYQFPTQY